MPIVFRAHGYRVFFFSSDRAEPVHVHVAKGRGMAKFWLGPVRLARNKHFRSHELREIARLLATHENELIAAWHEYFNR